MRNGFDMEKKDVRIQLVMSPAEVAALDDWRAERRIWSRSEAIRRLIVLGRTVADATPESPKAKKLR